MLKPSAHIPQVTHEDGSTSGTTLLAALHCILSPTCPNVKPFHLPLLDVSKFGGIGAVVVGQVETDVIKPTWWLTLRLTVNATTEV